MYSILELQSGLLFTSGTPVQPMVVRPCQYREKDGTYRKKGIDTMTWTWNQNLSLFSLFYLTLAQPRSYFEVSRTSCLVKLPIQSDINLNYQSCNSVSQISYNQLASYCCYRLSTCQYTTRRRRKRRILICLEQMFGQ